MATELWAIGMILLADLIGSFGPVFIKKGTATLHRNFWMAIKNKDLLIGIFAYGIATLLFIPALKGGELSVLYPFVSISYILVSFYSIKFLNEKMNKMKWIGILFILIGVTFIGIGS